jgi:hypothetical protein
VRLALRRAFEFREGTAPGTGPAQWECSRDRRVTVVLARIVSQAQTGNCVWPYEERSRAVSKEMSAADAPQQVTVVFRKPVVRPGTPEAQALGCLCRFESNMAAGFLTAERGDDEKVIVVIHKDCPLHEIVSKPVDDALGEF